MAKRIIITVIAATSLSLIGILISYARAQQKLTTYEDKQLFIYQCTQPIKAKQGFYYNLDGKHAGLEPADQTEFKKYCHYTGIE